MIAAWGQTKCIQWMCVSNLIIQGGGGRTGLVVRASDSGSGCVVSLSKRHLLPKSTGNTQEWVAPSQHD